VYCVLTPLKGQYEDMGRGVVCAIKVFSLSFRGTPLPLKRNSRFGRKSSKDASIADVTGRNNAPTPFSNMDTDTYSLRTSQRFLGV